ncbi:MAG: glycosyltransferase [Acidobacteria bacterium]|nr:MAG: glycosyltransferase [Acidobacteriota bacterium]
MSETVSVVIPTYNRARFAVRAVESVLEQTRPPDETIVIDDGSTDGTADALAPLRGRIRYVRRENAGQAAARNHGARIARGRWLAFLDSDDWWEPQRLERLMAYAARRREASAWTTAARVCTWEGKKTSRVIANAGPGELIDTLDVLTRDKGSINGCSILVERDLFFELGGFDESLRSAEDVDLWLRLTRRAGPIAMLPEPLLCYRHHPGNISRNVARDAGCWIAILEKFAAAEPEFAREHARVLEDALLSQHMRAGRAALADCERSREGLAEARAHFRAVLRRRPADLRALRYLLWSFVAPGSYGAWRRLEDRLRGWKRGAPA